MESPDLAQRTNQKYLSLSELVEELAKALEAKAAGSGSLTPPEMLRWAQRLRKRLHEVR